MPAFFKSQRFDPGRLKILPGIILLTAAAVLFSCQARDSLLFDDPAPEVVLSGTLRKEPRGGGTFYWGDARNIGSLAAENVLVHINPLGAGGGSLGTFTTPVGVGYDEAEEEVINTLDPEVQGSFNATVPVSFQSIASETYFFTFKSPVEEE